jgi:hypothetical protein
MKLDHYRLDIRDRGQLLLTAAAVTFGGLFLLGLIGFVLADLASYPSPFSTTTSEVEDYFRESRDATRFNAFVQLAAAVPCWSMPPSPRRVCAPSVIARPRQPSPSPPARPRPRAWHYPR